MSPEQEKEILGILDGAKDLTIATVRADGYPQATTVSFVHIGLKIYFGCAADSQKALNIQRSSKVSVTVDLPYERWDQIRSLSLGGRAHIVADPKEAESVFAAMTAKFPQISDFATDADLENGVIVCVEPEVIYLLDYRKGFGHLEEVNAG